MLLLPNQKFFFVIADKYTILDSFDVDGKNIDVEEKPLKIELFLKKVDLLTQN
ncbi:hypothetical protein [Nitrosopumilus ureiphilus]|uniref:hypothetical protein n=1 Tax=Nitrosopumilus ureiphilus TaxID=1470067 RepID=UPI001FE5F365|nr:hypothetical protein [Nitrosopumilus ureiphilus]